MRKTLGLIATILSVAVAGVVAPIASATTDSDTIAAGGGTCVVGRTPLPNFPVSFSGTAQTDCFSATPVTIHMTECLQVGSLGVWSTAGTCVSNTGVNTVSTYDTIGCSSNILDWDWRVHLLVTLSGNGFYITDTLNSHKVTGKCHA
jgi:hypothetical protein